MVYNNLGLFWPLYQDTDHLIQDKFMSLEHGNENLDPVILSSLLKAQFYIRMKIQHAWTRYPLGDSRPMNLTTWLYTDITEVILVFCNATIPYSSRSSRIEFSLLMGREDTVFLYNILAYFITQPHTINLFKEATPTFSKCKQFEEFEFVLNPVSRAYHQATETQIYSS